MKVLLVDDHPLILSALQAMIQELDPDVQVTAVGTRYYPYGALAAQTLGYLRKDSGGDAAKGTFKEAGTVGWTGLEKAFDPLLQGKERLLGHLVL